ncbi:MAG: SGNH/GDSL hydrolase family protein [Oscillatoriales cyanobacterium C42_A2020_001]|nr:SGNH/GDSL hydrolase family protein [Leptolyngbyaceae cyanobacterium C42_A2020_001]
MKLNKFGILLIALLLLLGGSVLLNVLLYNRAVKYYVELNQTRLDPFGLKVYPANPIPRPNAKQNRVVLLGDSRAAEWSAPNISGFEFINRGIGSQTSIQVAQRFANHMRPLQPDVIVIQVGVNDLKTIGLFPTQKAAIAAACKQNIQHLVEDSKKLGAIVIVTTIFPVGEVPLERKPFWSDAIAEAVKDVNTFITGLASDQVIVFDTVPILADNQGKLSQQYREDELHLNPQGYAALNQKLIPLLNTIKLNPR